MEYQPHGPIHTLVGGVGGANYKQMLLSLAPSVDSKFVETW